MKKLLTIALLATTAFGVVPSAKAASSCYDVGQGITMCGTLINDNTTNLTAYNPSDEKIMDMNVKCVATGSETFEFEYNGESILNAKDNYDTAKEYCDGFLFGN